MTTMIKNAASLSEPDAPLSEPVELSDRERMDVLAARICAAATVEAQSCCHLLELIGEFDREGFVQYWRDVKSIAHWLSWCTSMSPGAARERVRVARSLPLLPTVTDAFREGRLSYSKVREVSRVAGIIDDEKLCELALVMTASQLARTVSGFRRCEGSRLGQQDKRTVSWHTADDGMLVAKIRLPAEEGAVFVAALQTVMDTYGQPPANAVPRHEVDDLWPGIDPPATSARDEANSDTGERAVSPDPATIPVEEVSKYTMADASLDVSHGFLNTAPEDRSGEDRDLMVVQVSAETLAEHDRRYTPDHQDRMPTGQPSAPEPATPERATPEPATPEPAAAGADPTGQG